MEIDALALVIIVIAVALTTFVCTFLAKFCFEKYVDGEFQTRRQRKFRSFRTRRAPCHCHRCPPGLSQALSSKKSLRRIQDAVAINVSRASEEDIRLRTFAPSPLAVPTTAADNASPSETFARLGIRMSKDSKNFDFDRQLQLAHTSSSEINISNLFFIM